MYSWEPKLTTVASVIRPVPAFGMEPDPISVSGLEEHTVNLRMRPVCKRVRHQQLFAAGLLVTGIILPFALEESGFIEDDAFQSLVRTVFFGAALLLIIYSRRNTDPLGLRDKKAPVLANEDQVSQEVFGSPWTLEEYEGRNNRSRGVFTRQKSLPEGTQEERFTFLGLENLSRIPGVKILYGELFPDEAYSGTAHTVICGNKVALVETLPYVHPSTARGTEQEERQASERLKQYRSLISGEWSQGLAGRKAPEVRGIIVSYNEQEKPSDISNNSTFSISDAVEKLGNWFISDPQGTGVVDRQLLAYLIELNNQG